jgi:hypothetical protein
VALPAGSVQARPMLVVPIDVNDGVPGAFGAVMTKDSAE